MKLFRFDSIQKKLTVIIAIVAIAALLISNLTFFIFELYSFERSSRNELESISRIIATHTAAALDFGDPETGNETLQPLVQNKKIAAAYILDSNGNVFASYIRNDLNEIFPADKKIDGDQLSNNYITIENSIDISGTFLGTIYIVSDEKELKSNLLDYLYLLLLTTGVISILIFFSSLKLQTIVSKPILKLAEIAKTVSRDKDYSKRFDKQTDDEIGYLAEKFNEMMLEIEKRDGELENSRDLLENRVKQRTKELEDEVKERINAEKNLKFKTEYEQLLIKLSNHFINLSSDMIDHGINNSLKQIADFCDVDRCYIYQFNEDQNNLRCTHHYYNPRIPDKYQMNKDIDILDLPIFFKKVLEAETICINKLAELPEYADHEKQEFIKRGIKSIISVPLSYSENNVGVVCFDLINNEINWPDYTISLLSFSSEMLVNVLIRKNYLDQLSKSRKMLDLVMDNIPQAIFWKNKEFYYMGCNKTFAEHAGLASAEEVVGKKDSDLPWSTTETEEYYNTELRVLKEADPEYKVIQKQTQSSGKEATILINRIPLIGSNGEVFGILGTYEDVTQKNALERELIKTQKLESLGVLAGGIAHDFNNMLTGIVGSIALVQQELFTKGVDSKRLTDIENALYRAKDLTVQLLTFAKGGQPIKRNLHLNKILRETAELSLRGSNVKCEYFIPDDLWPVLADEGQITQVINNLVINADQSMVDGGIIKIYAENIQINDSGLPLKKGDYVKLIVEDRGIGITENDLAKIFDPYFTTKKHGHGLGLATTYSIISKHNGHINVKSIPGKGTTVEFFLPVIKKFTPREKKLHDLKKGSGNILLMEDDNFVRETVGEMLCQLGYEVKLASNGYDAINIFKSTRDEGDMFDAVILDLTIPGGLGGKETVKKLLSIDPDVKAIVSTGYYNDPVISDYKKYGFVDLIPKPYKAKELSEVLFRVIGKVKH